MPRVNEKINTPLGEGIVQGPFAVVDAAGENIITAVLVRLPVNETTRSHLNKSNCITPKAQLSALFVFPLQKVSILNI